MLMPKRTKWRKQQRGRIRGEACRGNEVAFGQFGLQSLEPGWVSARVIEAGRIACGRNAPEGKVFIRSFFNCDLSSRISFALVSFLCDKLLLATICFILSC